MPQVAERCSRECERARERGRGVPIDCRTMVKSQASQVECRRSQNDVRANVNGYENEDGGVPVDCRTMVKSRASQVECRRSQNDVHANVNGHEDEDGEAMDFRFWLVLLMRGSAHFS